MNRLSRLKLPLKNVVNNKERANNGNNGNVSALRTNSRKRSKDMKVNNALFNIFHEDQQIWKR